ncbi:MAG: PAS domain S-box protein [Nitrospinae bacterium]|nr:PAS domain S-box protein [Nitrospinota bacterium]
MPVWARGRWSWVWVVLSGASVAAVVFAAWELIQQNYFQHLEARTLHYLYITRGIALAFFLVAWAACIIVAHRRSAIEHLRRSEMKYRQLIEDAHDAIVVFDTRGVVLEWNPQASRLFGYARDEVIARSLPTLAADAHARFFDFLDRLVDGREESGLKHAAQKITKGGEVREVSLSLFPYPARLRPAAGPNAGGRRPEPRPCRRPALHSAATAVREGDRRGTAPL